MKFKQRAKEAAFDTAVTDADGHYVGADEESFIKGAAWGYERAIFELRSCSTLDNDPYLPTLVKRTAEDWAQWLIDKMRSNK